MLALSRGSSPLEKDTSRVLALPEPVVESDDDRLIGLWLHGRPATTRRAYLRDLAALSEFARKPISNITLNDLQAFSDSLVGAPATRARILSSVKSLFTFAVKIGYLQRNVGAALRLPARRSRVGERLLSEGEVARLIAATANGRDRCLLALMYVSGARVSEICNLRWRDVQVDGTAGVLSIFGKGGKERSVRLTPRSWLMLEPLRSDASPSDYVFRTRTGKVDTSTVWRIMRAAAQRAALEQRPSPHWLRHAAASHALSRGASLALVRDTLGHSSISTTSVYVHARPSESLGEYLDV